MDDENIEVCNTHGAKCAHCFAKALDTKKDVLDYHFDMKWPVTDLSTNAHQGNIGFPVSWYTAKEYGAIILDEKVDDFLDTLNNIFNHEKANDFTTMRVDASKTLLGRGPTAQGGEYYKDFNRLSINPNFYKGRYYAYDVQYAKKMNFHSLSAKTWSECSQGAYMTDNYRIEEDMRDHLDTATTTLRQCVERQNQFDEDWYDTVIEMMSEYYKDGSYINENDPHMENWQESQWGTNYPELYRIKQKYDPTGLLTCWHCVGSEDWYFTEASRGYCLSQPASSYFDENDEPPTCYLHMDTKFSTMLAWDSAIENINEVSKPDEEQQCFDIDSVHYVAPTDASCDSCKEAKPCFEAMGCGYINEATARWEGVFGPCNGGANKCASCFRCGGGLKTQDECDAEEEAGQMEANSQAAINYCKLNGNYHLKWDAMTKDQGQACVDDRLWYEADVDYTYVSCAQKHFFAMAAQVKAEAAAAAAAACDVCEATAPCFSSAGCAGHLNAHGCLDPQVLPCAPCFGKTASDCPALAA